MDPAHRNGRRNRSHFGKGRGTRGSLACAKAVVLLSTMRPCRSRAIRASAGQNRLPSVSGAHPQITTDRTCQAIPPDRRSLARPSRYHRRRRDVLQTARDASTHIRSSDGSSATARGDGQQGRRTSRMAARDCQRSGRTLSCVITTHTGDDLYHDETTSKVDHPTKPTRVAQ